MEGAYHPKKNFWNGIPLPPMKAATSNTSLVMASYYRYMFIEPTLSVALCIYCFLAVSSSEKLVIVGIILLLWLIAPIITWWASKPLAKQVSLLSENQNIFLRKLARKTWSYFEHFVEEKDNWLPPDNFQEQPEACNCSTLAYIPY